MVSAGREFAIKVSEWAGLYLLGKALVGVGDLDSADAWFTASTSGFTGIALEGWAPVNFRSSRAYAEGRYQDGDALGVEAYELGAGLGDTNEIVDSARILISRLERGDRTTAAIAIERVETTAIGMFGPYRARLAVETGDLDTGHTAFAAWIEQVFPQLPGVLRCLYAGVAVPVAVGLRDVESAAVLGEYLTPFRGELVGDDAWIYGAVDYLIGACAGVRGRLDEAVELMRAGHARHEDLGLRARVVQSGLDLGRVLLERGAPGDREAGEEHLRHCVSLANELGMTPYAEAATVLL